MTIGICVRMALPPWRVLVYHASHSHLEVFLLFYFERNPCALFFGVCGSRSSPADGPLHLPNFQDWRSCCVVVASGNFFFEECARVGGQPMRSVQKHRRLCFKICGGTRSDLLGMNSRSQHKNRFANPVQPLNQLEWALQQISVIDCVKYRIIHLSTLTISWSICGLWSTKLLMAIA